MEDDPLATHRFGRVALRKMARAAELGPGFRLNLLEWMGAKPADWDTMRVRGAQYRAALSGPNKGKLSILVPGTMREVFVSKAEVAAAEAAGADTEGARSEHAAAA